MAAVRLTKTRALPPPGRRPFDRSPRIPPGRPVEDRGSWYPSGADGLALRAPGRSVLLLPERRRVHTRAARAPRRGARHARRRAHRPRRPLRRRAVRERVPQEGVKPLLGASLTIRGRDVAPEDGTAEGSPRRSGLAPGRRPARRARATRYVGAPRPQRRGLREPLPTHHRRAHARRARRSVTRPRPRSARTRQGLIVVLGPRSAPGRLAVAGAIDAARRAAGPFREAFGATAVRRGRAPRRGRLPRRDPRDAPVRGARSTPHAVATNPVRYLVPEDAFLADALECMRAIVPIASNHVTRTNAEGWLKPAARRCARCSPSGRTCATRPSRSPSAARSTSGSKRVHFPEFPTPAGRSADVGARRALLAGRRRAGRGGDHRGRATGSTTSSR